MAAHKQQAEAYRDYIELWIHEIKTPIAAAALMASGLHGPQAARIKGELDRIEGYVEQALYYARSTSLVQDYAIRETSLAEAVREALRKHARFLIERGVAPTVDVNE
ncbi:MAG: sensor histidine kinase, partial [Eggerthella lenta]